MEHEDHNVEAASLELLNEILNSYGKIPEIMGTRTDVQQSSNTFLIEVEFTHYSVEIPDCGAQDSQHFIKDK